MCSYQLELHKLCFCLIYCICIQYMRQCIFAVTEFNKSLLLLPIFLYQNYNETFFFSFGCLQTTVSTLFMSINTSQFSVLSVYFCDFSLRYASSCLRTSYMGGRQGRQGSKMRREESRKHACNKTRQPRFTVVTLKRLIKSDAWHSCIISPLFCYSLDFVISVN